MDDLALGDPTPSTTTDEPLAQTAFGPATFDLARWVAGVVPTRRSETVYQRADLLAEIDRIAAAEAVAPKGQRAALVEQATALTDQLRASGVTFVVEGRTSSWVLDTETRLKAQGVTDSTDVLLHQLAEQIVEPAGVTFEMLRRLADVAEPQVVRLVTAMTAANSAAPRIDPRFSRAS